MLGRKWVLRTPFEGVAKLSDFKLVEELIVADSLQNGEILCRALWLSVDPYMRVAGGSQDTLLEGGVLPGSQVAIVEKSNHKDYPVGTLVLGYFGWRDLTLFQPDLVSRPMYFYKLPDLKGLSPSYFLGAVGMPGNTALFGLEKVLGVKEGSTVVISSAAGAVGGVACQIAKMKGCKVLAFTGSFEKTVWLKEIGAGYIFDYNITDVDKVIKEFAPEGVDFFFDNVGGDFSSKVMRNMKQNGIIALCGAISQYNQQTNGHSQSKIPFDYKSFIYKKLKMEGFLVSEWESEWQESLMRLRDWVVQGKLQVQETITEGFDKMPEAFLNLFEGKNIGKMVVKV